MQADLIKKTITSKISGSLSGYELIRDILLPQIIGQNSNFLYWAGKELARELYLQKDEEIPLFFEEVNWGKLTRKKSKVQQQRFELSGPVVALRLKNDPKADFKLEAGFLAQTVEQQTGLVTEAIVEEANKHTGTVKILVQVDHGNSADMGQLTNAEPLNLSELLQSADNSESKKK